MSYLGRREFTVSRLVGIAVFMFALLVATPGKGLALSEIKPVDAPDSETTTDLPPLEGPLSGPDGGPPAPDPLIRKPLPQPEQDPNTEPSKGAQPDTAVEVITDLSHLPEPARRMRELIIEAATSGDPEKLRSLFGTGPTATLLFAGEIDVDPVDYIRSISGDGEGLEILAILIDLLNTGFVRIDRDEPDETYIWPYFAALSLDELTPPQMVEMLRLVTSGDVEDMKAFGGYNFFRVGISPDGQWRFFLAGD